MWSTPLATPVLSSSLLFDVHSTCESEQASPESIAVRTAAVEINAHRRRPNAVGRDDIVGPVVLDVVALVFRARAAGREVLHHGRDRDFRLREVRQELGRHVADFLDGIVQADRHVLRNAILGGHRQAAVIRRLILLDHDQGQRGLGRCRAGGRRAPLDRPSRAGERAEIRAPLIGQRVGRRLLVGDRCRH